MSEDSPRIVHLFDEALRHPSPGFALGERLAALFRDRHLIEHDGGVDVAGFARAGHILLEARPGLYHQRTWSWHPETAVHSKVTVGWQTATFAGVAHDVVRLEWPSGSYGSHTRTFILSPDRAAGIAFYAAIQRWQHELRAEVLVYSGGCFSKSEKLYAAIQAASFDQLVLEGPLVRQIREDFTRFAASRATYEEHGIPWRRGALLVGPPGNGKTLCVKALVRELGLPCMYIQSLEDRHSTPQRHVEEVFRRARAQAPCIMVLEDIDALLVPSARSLYLNELDGFAQNTGIITIATTNHAERLDPSIVERPSRFDRKYHFDLPGHETRAAYIELWNQRLKPELRLSEAGRAQLTELTGGFSFAYVQEVFVSALTQWAELRTDFAAIAVEQVGLLRAQMTRKQ